MLRTGIKPTPCQKSFEFVAGTESRVVNFQWANKQFSFLSISLVYDKSDQHGSIYDSYNNKLAITKIKSIKLENTSNTHSTFNSVKFDTADAHDKYLLYSQFIAWYCKGSSIALLLDYAHNPIYQELRSISKYFASSDQKIFIDLRRGKGYANETEKLNRDDSDRLVTVMLKNAAAKKMRLHVTGYYQGEYLYSLSNNGLIINYKEYGINKQKITIS